MKTNPNTTEVIDIVDGIEMYRVGPMEPFLMSVVSSNDLWMFLSSTGGLTAGRVNAGNSLFPYETDDRLHHLYGRVGPVTLLRVDGGDTWEPFDQSPDARLTSERSLRKSLLTDAAVFEDSAPDLGITMRYRWAPSDRFGWVRTAWLTNTSGTAIEMDILDGLLGLMPWGINLELQQQMSNLANAYRRSEIAEAGIGLYTLESRISDLPQPAEAMKATAAWSVGLGSPSTLSVDPQAVRRFREHATSAADHVPQQLLTGRPGAYLIRDTITLEPGETRRWHIVGDVNLDHGAIAGLIALHHSDTDIAHLIDADIAAGHRRLDHLIGGADGKQATASKVTDAHHGANTLFNIMRGGTFTDGYTIEKDRFIEFVQATNSTVASTHATWLEQLDSSIEVADLIAAAAATDDPHLTRIAMEYLPLSFSRRHGDPSRPWNKFEIRIQDEAGYPVLAYQGNWRDIFQNWEALCRTYPQYLPSVIARFLNASTADGFNPYRINSEGIDWEVPDPDDPWSGIGYWGDHQIVYLYRLLKTQHAHQPGWLNNELTAERYAFADVPYRVVPYASIVDDPKNTIDFDDVADREVADRVAQLGADGRLLQRPDGSVALVSMLEKLLVSALAKLSNYVPRGGIWMNTERPEWNDANNALVGYGVSMVTLSYLYRYLEFLNELAADLPDAVALSADVASWLEQVTVVLERSQHLVHDGPVDDAQRAEVVNGLGTAFGEYRSKLYESGPSGSSDIASASVRRLIKVAQLHLRDAIVHARRADGLFDAYNLIEFSDDHREVAVRRLQPMLEGQVAAISTGVLEPAAVANLVDTMFASDLYRPDVDSFVLYPAIQRPSFMERNVIDADAITNNPLLTALVEAGDTTIVCAAVNGKYYFNGEFRNADDLTDALDNHHASRFAELVAEHRNAVLDLYEDVFDHQAFTGRSASMYAFEGIGSVYWHMVAKLLLAIQEVILDAPTDTDRAVVAKLTSLYDRVRSGLGFNKSAIDYGAFPTDPYSHTPAHAGAQQPGMTGQVKEELLTRWAEVGVVIDHGQIVLTPRLVGESEFGTDVGTFQYVDVGGDDTQIDIAPGAISFTLCRTPMTARLGDDATLVTITDSNGVEHQCADGALPAEWSSSIFAHDGKVRSVDVVFARSELGRP